MAAGARAGERLRGKSTMIKKWSVSYPAVNGTEQRRAYVYLPTMY